MTRFRFVEAEAAQFPVSLLCRVVGVSRQGFYAWKRRSPSTRELADRKLSERIKQIYTETEEIYGAPRIYSELKLGDCIRVGKKRVARLMRQLGLRGADGRRGGPRTTVRDPKRASAPDLVDRAFARAEPNRLWVCDLKYIQTGQGFLFLAAVQDVFSRRIIGWSIRDDLKSELVLDALGMAVTLAAVKPPASWRIRITGRNTRAWSTAPTPSSPGSTSRWARSATPGTGRGRDRVALDQLRPSPGKRWAPSRVHRRRRLLQESFARSPLDFLEQHRAQFLEPNRRIGEHGAVPSRLWCSWRRSPLE